MKGRSNRGKERSPKGDNSSWGQRRSNESSLATLIFPKGEKQELMKKIRCEKGGIANSDGRRRGIHTN